MVEDDTKETLPNPYDARLGFRGNYQRLRGGRRDYSFNGTCFHISTHQPFGDYRCYRASILGATYANAKDRRLQRADRHVVQLDASCE